jgi:phosphatidylserine/phosphatidylglycerophosphate/cardiolipin synthase-like enzyme
VEDAHGELTLRREIPEFALERWYLREELFRRQGHVFFVHTKFLLIDPLGEDPLLFTGSANFSSNSLLANDENMLLIRGNKRAADIYLTEFDRLLRHFFFRDVAANGASDKGKFLAESAADWVPQQFSGFKDVRRRMFFPA